MTGCPRCKHSADWHLFVGEGRIAKIICMFCTIAGIGEARVGGETLDGRERPRYCWTHPGMTIAEAREAIRDKGTVVA